VTDAAAPDLQAAVSTAIGVRRDQSQQLKLFGKSSTMSSSSPLSPTNVCLARRPPVGGSTADGAEARPDVGGRRVPGALVRAVNREIRLQDIDTDEHVAGLPPAWRAVARFKRTAQPGGKFESDRSAKA
jgi:hypothetical protein